MPPSNGRPAKRGDSDHDDDRGRRSQNPYFRKNQGKTKPDHHDMSDDDVQEILASFITARQQLAIHEAKKNKGNPCPDLKSNPVNYGNEILGMRPRGGPRGAFIPPSRNNKVSVGTPRTEDNLDNVVDESTRRCLEMLSGPDRLRNIEPKLLEHITNEIMERDPMVRWDDIDISRAVGLPQRVSIVWTSWYWEGNDWESDRRRSKGNLLFDIS